MSSSPQPLHLRPSRWMLIGTVVLLVFAAFFWWAARRETAAEREIQRLLAELRAVGEPVNAADLARLFPNPSAAEDAGTWLTNILVFAADNRPPAASPIVNANMVFTRNEPFPEPALAELRAYHEQTKAIWEQWPRPWPAGMQFASHWERGMMSNSVPNFIKVRALAQMLATLAFTAAEDNDPQRAADMLERGFCFAQTIPSDSLVTHMIKTACAGLDVAAAERCLNRTQFTERQLLQIASALPHTDTNHFANALRGEHVLAIWAFQEVKAGRSLDDIMGRNPGLEPWWKSVLQKFLPRLNEYNDHDFLHYLALYRRSLDATLLPPVQAVAQTTQQRTNYSANVTSGVAQAVPAHWPKALMAHFEFEARLSALKVAIALERFRLAHEGKIPATLNELIPDYLPEVPRDIFDGQPLRFKNLPRGYVLYSLGADGVDNGGLEKTSATTNYDVTITVER